jgi:hypothetical protein
MPHEGDRPAAASDRTSMGATVEPPGDCNRLM